MSAPTILAVKPGSISKADRRRLMKAGVVVIEHERPEEVRPVQLVTALPSSSAMLRCAIEALAASNYDGPRTAFVESLAAAIRKSK